MDSAQPAPAPGCPFCEREALDFVLEETAHFYLLVDHAPLTEGHLLIVPHTHFACYGAVPAHFDDELLALKRQVTRFLHRAYGPHVFFEHGVFRQTVYHAHLHAIPIGDATLDASQFALEDALEVRAQSDLRTWYASRGHYFYLESPGMEGVQGSAIAFPPVLERYWQVLGTLRAAAGRRAKWEPQPIRRALGGDMMRSVADAWRAARA